MRAHVIDNNIVVNTIVVESLAPGLIDASQGGAIGDTWNGKEFISPLPEITPAVIPESVTMRQARLMLLQQGMLDAVETAIGAVEDDATRKAIQIEWEYALDLRRDWPALQMITQAMGIDGQQLDTLFIDAAKL